MATQTKVVVELTQGGRQISYQEVSLAEAKEILGRRMVNHFRWSVPTWQFDDTGATPESVLQERQREAYRAIRAAE